MGSNGKENGRTEYNDVSSTTSLTGLWAKDGKELVLSINSFGHLCFFTRSYDSLDFIPPTVGNKFMPHCMPANMLYGCPQSFCYTGFMDEILVDRKIWSKKEGNWKTFSEETVVKWYRGQFRYMTEFANDSVSIYNLKRWKTTPLVTLFPGDGHGTVVAAYTDAKSPLE